METAVPAPADGAAFNTLDLDRLFHEGDDQTWDVEDWNWDPYQIMAEPKGSPTRGNTQQQPLKRHKADHNTQPTAAAAAGLAAAAPGGCHATAVPQQGLNLGTFGSFQNLLHGGATCQDLGISNPALWGQQQQQQQAAMLAQLQQQQQMAAGNPAAAAATAACGSTCHANAPAPLRSCQALAHGLPFLAPDTLANMFQQQQQQEMLSRHASLTSMNATAAAAQQNMAAAHSAPPNFAVNGLDLSATAAAAAPVNSIAAAMQQQQQQQQAGSPAAAAAPSPSGVSSSVAESGSDGAAATAAAMAQQHLPHIALSNTTAAAAAALAPDQQQQQLTSPSTITSAPPITPALNTAAAATAADSEAAAVSIAAAAADADGDGDQKLVCQVPGCGRDLSGLKEYHQRYRICDVHIKLPQVMKDGRLQRFCQQCGRFHDLSAFDGNRKSCREQLQKHNARRRRRAQLEQNMSLADSLLNAVDDKSDVGKLLQGLLSNPFQLQALRVLLGVQTHPALPNQSPAPAEHMPQLTAAGTLPAATASAPPTYEVARDIMDGAGSFAPTFDSDQRVIRLSAKLFNVTPADLPPDVRQQLTGWLHSAPAAVEGYIRPGCVLMTLHMTVDKSEYEAATVTGMQRLLQQALSPASHPFWHSHTYMLQLFNTVAVIYHGNLISLTTMTEPDLAVHKLPRQISVSPLCLVSSSSSSLTLSGHSISSPDCTLVVKGRGTHCYLGGSSSSSGAATAAKSGCSCCQQQPVAAAAAGVATCAREVVTCQFNTDHAGCGVLWVEVARGAYISETRPVLVVDDPQVAQEVNALQQLEGTALSSTQVDSLLLDLGLVLSHIKSAPGAATVNPTSLNHHDIAEKARRLIAFACDHGWLAVARAVLPLAQACGACAAEVVAAIHSSTAQDGLSLLHRAVRSGSPALVRGILDWGAANNYQWSISAGGPGGITPLHLASLLDDDGVIALMLLDACGTEGASALTDARAVDGVTPFHLAFQMGRYSLDRVLAGLGVAPAVKSVVEQQLQPNGWQLLKIAADASDVADADPNSAAAAAAAAVAGKRDGSGVPLKERLTSCLDACLYCQSTLPPLLLSIKAKCAGCGIRQPCVQDEDPATPPAVAAAAAAARQQQQQRIYPAPVAAAAAVAAGLDGCAHVNGRVLSVTALCQACHANRVLEVV